MSFTTDEATKSLSLNAVPPCCCFSLAEIQSATRNFDAELIIGHGGFGNVYRGCISINETSHVVAVKRLDSMSNQGAPEFRAEIEMLSKLRHCHLATLIGYCDDNEEMILVYDYMPQGTLHDRLHKVDTPLTWVQRLKIAIGAARGLDYLHTGVGTKHGVIHRDIKSSNILLDENLAAMISDFGLSKIGPTNQSSSYVDASVKGTFGYLDSEYFYTRRLTRKTDVFAFGVVLFELLSGRLPVDERYGEEQCSLVRWAQKRVKERKLDQLVDSKIKGTIFPKCLKRFAQVAYRCIHGVPKERPPMTEVVALLQALLELQNKHDLSSESPGVVGFTWKIYKYLVSAPTKDSDKSGTSSPKSLENNMNQHEELAHEELVLPEVKMFTYDELKRATSGFGNDTCLGEDDYGTIYSGWVDKTTYSPCMHNVGLPIAVKKVHRYENGIKILRISPEFNRENLKEFCHPNLVQLVGYCLEGEQLFLVYEIMHNGNFNDILDSGAVAQLPLVTKVKIALGIARGIVFLERTQPKARKSQLDRSKILLDKDFTAKLSDYDNSILVHVLGPYPPVMDDMDQVMDDMDVCHYYPGFEHIVLRCNLSSFKVVFLEVITGEQIYNINELWKIKRFFRHCGKEDLSEIATVCYKSCNDVDSESKMVRLLEEYDKLIRTRLKSWLLNPKK